MITAIFEILGLLTVSCLIGIFFTYRYWKAKYQLLINEKLELEKEVRSLTAEIDVLKRKIKELESALKMATENVIEKESKRINAKEIKSRSDAQITKALKGEIALLKEAMGEKEREIEELSIELEKRKISYYKVIDGKRYKGITIKMADDSIAGRGDGRISMEDAEKIFDTISDGKAYTQVEKDTLRRLRTHYKWTERADELFRKKVRSWAAKGHVLDRF
ncbi:MAG: hypothetical protein ACFHWX_08495 [Bacteroidota bacterium]